MDDFPEDELMEDAIGPDVRERQRREAQLNASLSANAELLEINRTLRLEIATLKGTIEGLQRRVARFEHLGLGGARTKC